jgi:glutathione S-transferase
MQAQGDGLCDTAVGLRYETFLRPEERQWGDWLTAQTERLHRSVGQIEDMFLDDIADVDIGSIAVACALGYLDFRLPDLGWREGRPKLAAWYETFSARRSMVVTAPKAI